MVMEIVRFEKIFKKYNEQGKGQTLVLNDINFSVNKGEFIAILGPSGCGKSTLLNLLAGFDTEYEGSVYVNGQKVTESNHECVSVFQDHGLLPWRNVIDNVKLGLEFRGDNERAQEDISLDYIDLVGLKHVKYKNISELSGGMQQRVAIARALAVGPKILLLDEPFGALDEMMRLKLGKDLLHIWQEEKITIFFVTHNIDDAIYLADRIFVMGSDPGHIKEIINVNIQRPRRLTNEAFGRIKKRILNLFNIND